MPATTDTHTDYYLNQQPKMLKDFDKMLRPARTIFREYFDEAKIDRIYADSRIAFMELIPQLPYIGGKKSSGTMNLVGSAQLLAIIRTLEKAGLDERTIGKIVYQSMEAFFNARPRPVRWLMGKMMMSERFLERMRRQADLPHFRGGWRKVILEDEKFDFCQDVVECGIVTLYEQHGMSQYVPYLCLVDFAMFRSLGIGFSRTQTLGNGAPVCDFRFKKDGTTLPGWPPENLKEFTG